MPRRPTRASDSPRGAPRAREAAEGERRPRFPFAEIGVGAFDPVVRRLTAIEADGGEGELDVGAGVRLHVTNLGKIYFPDDGFTKGDVMRYYARVAAGILPTIADRPLVLRRHPGGITGPSFHQHDPGDDTPAGVRVERVPEANGEPARRLVGGDPASEPAVAIATLLYTIQLGAIAVNAWHSRVQSPDRPDYTVLDLDPGEGVPFATVIEVARAVREALRLRGLVPIGKTSGSRGFHVLAALPDGATFGQSGGLAAEVASDVAGVLPDIATVERSLAARPPGTVYVDAMQNSIGKTLATAFAIRTKPGMPVSTPLPWTRVDGSLDPRRHDARTVARRRASIVRTWRTMWSRG